jgi:FKBP-type peptidyl-prolyl cis-trans isomerase
MNKKILALAVFFCAIMSFTSCMNDDDDGDNVSDEWKTYNNKFVNDAASSSEYSSRASMSGNGSIYWKSIDDFIQDDTSTASLSTKITESGTPYITDSVSVRYEGWFYLLDGTKYTFDSTEGDKNGIAFHTRVNSGLVDGFATMLQYMKKGDQVEVCIPYLLGYGTTGSYSNNVLVIPGYTTLWFKMKLMDIYPDNPDEWNK